MSKELKASEAHDRGFWCGYGEREKGKVLSCPYASPEKVAMFWQGVALGRETREALGEDEGIGAILRESSVYRVEKKEGLSREKEGCKVGKRRVLIGKYLQSKQAKE